MESSGGYSRTSSFSCYKNGILFLLNKFYFKPFRKYFCLHTSLDSDSVSQLCESFGGFIRKWIREQLNLRKTFPVWWRMKHKGSLVSQCSVCGPGSSLSPTYTCRAQCYQASVWLKLSRCLLPLSNSPYEFRWTVTLLGLPLTGLSTHPCTSCCSTLRLGLFLIFLPADLKASVCFKMQSQNRSLGRLMWKQNCNFEIWKRQSWTFGGNLLAVLWHFQHRLTLRSDKCLGRNVTLKNVTVELHCVTLWSVCVCVLPKKTAVLSISHQQQSHYFWM